MSTDRCHSRVHFHCLFRKGKKPQIFSRRFSSLSFPNFPLSDLIVDFCHCGRVWQILNSAFLKTSSHYSNSSKFAFLKVSKDLFENTCAGVSFVIKLQSACKFIKKETPAQVFSCEFCRISENIFLQNTSEQLLQYRNSM